MHEQAGQYHSRTWTELRGFICLLPTSFRHAFGHKHDDKPGICDHVAVHSLNVFCNGNEFEFILKENEREFWRCFSYELPCVQRRGIKRSAPDHFE